MTSGGAASSKVTLQPCSSLPFGSTAMYFQMASLAHLSALVARKNRMISGVTAARP